MRRHLVLVGLSGSGKTAAGAVVAEQLGCRFHDLDAWVERDLGMSVTQVFTSLGEPRFREAERAAMHRALRESPQVIATGGGWAAQPGNLEGATPHGVVIYLECTPETAARRLEGAGDRPLLAGDHAAGLTRMLSERRAFYERAQATVETDGYSVTEVADRIVLLARSVGGW